MPRRLFSTKPVGELHEGDSFNELQRTLDARALVLLGIGAIIGTGIFVLTGTAAANQSGPAIVLYFYVAILVLLGATALWLIWRLVVRRKISPERKLQAGPLLFDETGRGRYHTPNPLRKLKNSGSAAGPQS